MALRVRKSVKIGPGVRLNVSHKSAGIRVGGRNAGVSVNSSGRKSASASIPGTGIGYQKNLSSSRSRASSSRSATATPPPPPPKPGLLASGTEKAFHKALNAYAAGRSNEALRLFRQAAEKDTKEGSISDDFFFGMLSVNAGANTDAISALEKVVTSQQALPDALMSKYVPGGGVEVGITEQTKVFVPFGSLCAALTLAEVYQEEGRIDEAIGLLEQLHAAEPHQFLALSLCELYAAQGEWDEITMAAAGVTNDDDLTLEIRLLFARAMAAQGMDDAAIEALRDCLRSKKRNARLLIDARYARAVIHARNGRKGLARKDLEIVYASDPTYRDVKERLAEMSGQ